MRTLRLWSTVLSLQQLYVARSSLEGGTKSIINVVVLLQEPVAFYIRTVRFRRMLWWFAGCCVSIEGTVMEWKWSVKCQLGEEQDARCVCVLFGSQHRGEVDVLKKRIWKLQLSFVLALFCFVISHFWELLSWRKRSILEKLSPIGSHLCVLFFFVSC